MLLIRKSGATSRERSGVVASLLAEKGKTLLQFCHGSLGSLDWRLSALEGGRKNFTLAIGLRANYNYYYYYLLLRPKAAHNIYR